MYQIDQDFLDDNRTNQKLVLITCIASAGTSML